MRIKNIKQILDIAQKQYQVFNQSQPLNQQTQVQFFSKFQSLGEQINTTKNNQIYQIKEEQQSTIRQNQNKTQSCQFYQQASNNDGGSCSLSFYPNYIDDIKYRQSHQLQDSVKSNVLSLESLARIAALHSVPFIGFGFIDNFIMISMGQQLDHLLGVNLGFSTFMAAGVGNVFADVCGILVADRMEGVSKYLPITYPQLNPEQRSSSQVRVARTIGQAGGIVVGCLLGLTPLLLFSKQKEQDVSTQVKVQINEKRILLSAFGDEVIED